MTDSKPMQKERAKLRPALWSGLLLGFLLTAFMAAFVYVAYLFLAWGQTAAAGAPKLPPLSLPQLVRASSSVSGSSSSPLDIFLQPAAQGQQEQPSAVTERVTILVMGVDSRPDEKIARSDSIMVLTVNPKTGAAGMLSLPRDLRVNVPGMSNPVKLTTVHFLGELDKYPGGGPALLRTTVSQLIGYPIDYYVRLNFEGFQQVIDLVGGVDIDVPTAINDPEYPDQNYGYDPLYIPAGRQHMNGALALKYARTRHESSDYSRAGRQQQILLALKDKIMQPGQLAALLPRLPSLALAMANSIQTDMPIEKAISLARALGQMDLHNPTRVVVDNTMGQEIPNDPDLGFVLIVDPAKLRGAAAAVFADASTGTSAAAETRQKLQAEGARLVVLNGTAGEGLAAKTAAGLTVDGFIVSAVGNASRADYAETWLITYGDDKPVTREALVRRFSIPPDRIRSEPSSSTADLALIVGADQTTAAGGQ